MRAGLESRFGQDKMTRNRKGSHPQIWLQYATRKGREHLIAATPAWLDMGLMGSSIAACLLAAGHTVAAVEADPGRLRKAPRRVLSLLEGLREERFIKIRPAKRF